MRVRAVRLRGVVRAAMLQAFGAWQHRAFTVMSTEREKQTWLAGLLQGWGMKEVWAKVLAGALLGILGALGVLGSTSCSADTAAKAARLHELYHTLSGQPCILVTTQK